MGGFYVFNQQNKSFAHLTNTLAKLKFILTS
jgi:hypothetical protein